MAEYNPARAKEGDRVRDTGTGDEYILRGGKWEPVEVTGLSSAGIGFTDKLIRNTLNTPAALERGVDAAATTVGAGLTAGAGAVSNMISGEPANFIPQFSQSMESLGATSAAETTIPRFGDFRNFGEDVRTGINAVASGTPLDRAREHAQLQAMQAREIFPRATAIGDFGADAAALLTARRPVAHARGRAAAKNRAAAEEFMAEFMTRKRVLDPDVQKALDDTATKAARNIKTGARSLGNFGIKVSEASLEGAYLAALNNDDPVVSAAAAAGAQASGSLGLALSRNIRGNIVPWVASAWATHEIWKVFAPGSTNFFESEDFAVRAAAGGLAVGVLGGLMGAGRLSSSAINYPKFADAITAIPRATLDNIFRQLRDSREKGDPIPEMILERIPREPDFFNENQMRSLMRAYNSERKDAFINEIDRLMRDSKDFRDKVAKMQEQRKPPPNTQFSGAVSPARELEIGTPTQPIQRN